MAGRLPTLGGGTEASGADRARWFATVRERGSPGFRRRVAHGRELSASCYCLIRRLTPAAPSVNLMPWVVALRVIRTPFWFCIVAMLPPPATAAPAPTAV